MEAAESPLEVLSRAAVMLQRNVLPPPSYDEARSLSQHQQQQKQKILRKCKPPTNDTSSFSASTTPYSNQTSNGSGKWKREKKYQHKTSTTSICDSTSSDSKSTSKFLPNVNNKCINNSSGGSDGGVLENEAEPLDMSKRAVAKERGEPPSYFQSMLCSNYSRRQSGTSTVIYPSSLDKSSSSTTTTAALMTTTLSTTTTTATATTTTTTTRTSCSSSSLSPTTSTDDKEAMCDQVINEHFRRSLGRDYLNVFSANKQPTNKEHEDDRLIETVQSPAKVHSDEDSQHKVDSRCVSPSPLSVDDHFAKALGETWIKLQQQQQQKKCENQKQVSCPSIRTTVSHQVNES